MAASENPRGAIQAAEIAVAEEEYESAEDALLEALSRVRKAKSDELEGSDDA